MEVGYVLDVFDQHVVRLSGFVKERDRKASPVLACIPLRRSITWELVQGSPYRTRTRPCCLYMHVSATIQHPPILVGDLKEPQRKTQRA